MSIHCKCKCHEYEIAKGEARTPDCRVSCLRCYGSIYVRIPGHIPDEQIFYYIQKIEDKINS